jgi:hypothetical protein
LFDSIQDLPYVFDPSRQFSILLLQSVLKERIFYLSFLILDEQPLCLSVQRNSAPVEKVHLEHLIVQAKHDRVLGLQPLLHIN